MLSISKAVLKEELTLAQRILNKWQLRLDEGIPGVDIPAGDELQFEAFRKEMVGEFQLIASKFDGLANIMAEDQMA
jgi:hypothetical protein